MSAIYFQNAALERIAGEINRIISWHGSEEAVLSHGDFHWDNLLTDDQGVIYRNLYEDDEINADQYIVDDNISRMADIRKSNGGKPLLHACVSAEKVGSEDAVEILETLVQGKRLKDISDLPLDLVV